MTAATQGSSPCFFFAVMAERAMQRRFAAVSRGFLPRLAPPCLPGYHSGSLSTVLKNMHNALGVGLPPPTSETTAL